MRTAEIRENLTAPLPERETARAKKKKSSLRNRLLPIFAVLLSAAGLCLLLCRPIGVAVTNRQHEAAVEEYIAAVDALSDEELTKLRENAEDFNRRCFYRRPYVWCALPSEDREDYETQLCVPGTDVIGYIEIPSIDVRLPIYHDASDRNMKKGCGHLESSSLPIGGKAAQVFLLSHRNMMTAVTFERLGELKEGDTFSVTVLKSTVTYAVDDIRVVAPDNTEEYGDIRIEEGKEYCTLVTCHPNGSSTHRLFVRGVRYD